MRNDHLRSNTRQRPIHRGDARSLGLKSGAWGLTFVAVFSASLALGGCVSDPDCGVCDPENLILETVAGVNYAGKVVKLLGPECDGPDCPGEITRGNYFVEKVVPCIETEEALEAARGVEEWCKVSPMIVDSGLQFIFNNLLDPQSVELVRKSPVNPQLFEVYDWKTRIVHLEGPIARYNGDYRPGTQTQPDQLTRLVSLSCIDNYNDPDLSLSPGDDNKFDHQDIDANLCDGLFVDPGTKKTIPLKMRMNQEVKTYSGEHDARRASQSCTTPQDGVDTCCDACDYELSVNVAKYGVTKALPEDVAASASQKLSPGNGAIECDPMGDKFTECADFIPHVDRSEEVRQFRYAWGGGDETFRVPFQDKLRETHPSKRPAGAEQSNVPCETREDCAANPGPNLPGMDCYQGHCVAEWFVECRAEPATTKAQGYCVDKRWNGNGLAPCFETNEPYPICADESCSQTGMESESRAEGRRFAYADADTSNSISALEGCRTALGGTVDGHKDPNAACDPYFQPGVTPIDRYDRKDTLPSITRNCVCEKEPKDGCADLVAKLCHVDGDPSKPIIKEKEGQYALKFISKNGGVIYDPAIKGVLFLPADLGAMPRSFAETCSAGRASGAARLNIKDGWRGNDNGFFESYENFDRAMCSSSTYKIVFAEPNPDNIVQYIRDKVGNTLKGKSTYVIHTPDFHVVPGSGFPTDNLRIGACDDFELRFSNKYDMSPRNLEKLTIVQLEGSEDDPKEGKLIAGGPGCARTSEELEAGMGTVPCLSINVRDQEIGSVRVEIDAKEFGAVLEPWKPEKPVRYRFKVPGLMLEEGEDVYEAMKKRPADYAAAFWDACGMPLVLSMPKLDESGQVSGGGKAKKPDYHYDFEIDAPQCKEDRDIDNFQFSCDNAPDVYNPDQVNTDGDEAGDVVDLCPTIPTMNTKADTDKDGIGNECDFCTRALTQYNKNAGDTPEYMKIRNIPDNTDTDRDGIGDVCDNCIVRANCGDWGTDAGQTPAGIGDPVPFDNDSTCQTDNADPLYIGDACIDPMTMMPIQDAGAAGPVGFGPMEDFDQDGIANMADLCPRQRVKACTADEECGAGATCGANMFCSNHADSDNDGVGDNCDSCPYAANTKQNQPGVAAEDDPDGDFVGNACETNSECTDFADPRPFAFYDRVAPSGMCCTTVFPEDQLDAPRLLANGDPLPREEIERLMMEYTAARTEWAMTMEGPEPVPPLFVPLKADCGGETPDKCRQLTDKVKAIPGIVTLPQGCAEAGQPLTLDSPSINGDADELYKYLCFLPQRDQDFDGVGDACDLCKYAFDPDNTLYKDQNNKVWPSNGQYCEGPWAVDVAPRLLSKCGDLSEEGGMTGTDTAGTTTGGTSTGP